VRALRQRSGLARRADRRQLLRLDELVIRPEAFTPHDLALAGGDERSLADLLLAQPDPGVPLEHLERALRRREHDLAPAVSEPERPVRTAG
jgi:hypothetical protein